MGYINGDYNTLDNPTTRKAQLKAIANGVISYYENHKEPIQIASSSSPQKPQTDNATGQSQKHVVAQGDTFYSICKAYGISQAAMIEANPNLKDPANLPINTSLNIPTTK